VIRLLHAIGIEIPPDLAENVVVARDLEVGLDDLAGIGLGLIAGNPKLLGRPQA
jgi:hypothetical protein